MQINKLIAGLAIALIVTPLTVSQASTPRKVTRHSQADIAKGKALFRQLQCASCHAVDENGGCLAPELNGVTQRRTQQYLMLRLSNTKGDEDKFIALIKHQELVPHPRFPRAQVKALIAYLSTFKPEKK